MILTANIGCLTHLASGTDRPVRHWIELFDAAAALEAVGAARMTRRIPTRAEFRHFLAIPTRWMDNDNYGHVNNVVYYSYFDTLVNEHLIRVAGLDFRNAPGRRGRRRNLLSIPSFAVVSGRRRRRD